MRARPVAAAAPAAAVEVEVVHQGGTRAAEQAGHALEQAGEEVLHWARGHKLCGLFGGGGDIWEKTECFVKKKSI